MKSRNNTVEFYRFFCSMMVMYYHAGSMTALFNLDFRLFQRGGLAITSFCILSGFLFARSFLREGADKRPVTGTLKLAKKKFLSFAFLWYLCLFCTMAVRLHYYNFDKAQTLDWLKLNWAEFFMLNGLFYKDNHINGATWYISALILSAVIYYFILSACERWIRVPMRILAAVCAVMLFVVTMLFGVTLLRSPQMTFFLTQFPFGMVSYFIFEKLRNVDWKGKKQAALQAAEVVFLIGFWICFSSEDLLPPIISLQQFLLILVSMGLTCIMFLRRTFLVRLLDRPVCGLLGKLSMGIYMSHMMLLVRWGWHAPFNLEQHALRGYVVIGLEAIALGAVFTGLNEIVKYGCKRLRQKKARAV